MPASDQSPRWVGAVHHDPATTVVSRCGQVQTRFFIERYHQGWITTDLELATCRSCLQSYSAEVLGPQPRARRAQQQLSEQEVAEAIMDSATRLGLSGDSSKEVVLDVALSRLRTGPPINEYDYRLIVWVFTLVGLQTDAQS